MPATFQPAEARGSSQQQHGDHDSSILLAAAARVGRVLPGKAGSLDSREHVFRRASDLSTGECGAL